MNVHTKTEIEAIPHILDVGLELTLEEHLDIYTEVADFDFMGFWKNLLTSRTQRPYPYQGGPVLGNPMEYEERLVYVDIAYDVAASIESVLKHEGMEIPELRPDMDIGSFGITSEQLLGMFRGELKFKYMRPIGSLERVPEMSLTNYTEETAMRTYSTAADLFSAVFFSSRSMGDI